MFECIFGKERHAAKKRQSKLPQININWREEEEEEAVPYLKNDPFWKAKMK